MTIAKNRAHLTASVAAFVLVFLAGCGAGDNGEGGTNTVSTTTFPRGGPQLINVDHSTFDAFLLASADNNPLFADVYAIRFDDFGVDRLTTDKRVSTLSADGDRLVVAAADKDVDRLAKVDEDGNLVPIPGLGRPFAYTPILRDGVMYFHDSQGEAKGKYRYYAWNLKSQTKTLTFASSESVGSAQPLGGGRFLVSTSDSRDLDQLVIRSKSSRLKEYPVGGIVSGLAPGKKYLAATIVAADDKFGDRPEALALVDLASGKVERIEGLQLICWNPAGTKLLARRTDSPTDSRLVLLDPSNPSAPVDVATVSGLVIYSGTWVRGEVPAAR